MVAKSIFIKRRQEEIQPTERRMKCVESTEKFEDVILLVGRWRKARKTTPVFFLGA